MRRIKKGDTKMCNIAKFAGKILLGIIAAALGFFIVTFTIYFFNLDMKATSLLEPLFIKHYDSMERKYYL